MSKVNGKVKIILLILAAVILVGAAVIFRSVGSAGAVSWLTNGGTWLLPLVVVASLVDSINPVHSPFFSLPLIFSSVWAVCEATFRRSAKRTFWEYSWLYILIDLGILQTLHLFSIPHFMAKLVAGFLIALGTINLLNKFFPAFPIKLKISQVSHTKIVELVQKAYLPTAFLLGSLMGLCEFPCNGGPYLLVLDLLHDQATYLRGFGCLLLYNLVFVLPLAVILGIASDSALLEKVKAWQKSNVRPMRLGGGLAMIILGTIIFLL